MIRIELDHGHTVVNGYMVSSKGSFFFSLKVKNDKTLGQGNLGLIKNEKLQSDRIMYFPSFSSHHFYLKTLGRRQSRKPEL